MSAPKSDNATIAARRARLLELLAAGNSQSQAVEVLRGEGFPADRITVWRDVKSFDLPEMVRDSQDMETFREMQLAELSDLKEQLKSPLIRNDKKVSLALDIIDREIRLLGTEAPTKSFRVNANISAGNEITKGFYVEFARRTMKLKHQESWQRLWDFIDSMPDDYKKEIEG